MDLHDARIRKFDVCIESRMIRITIDYWLSSDSSERKLGIIVFENVQFFSSTLDLLSLLDNQMAGNISYWRPCVEHGYTYIYMSDGILAVLSAEPRIEDSHGGI